MRPTIQPTMRPTMPPPMRPVIRCDSPPPRGRGTRPESPRATPRVPRAPGGLAIRPATLLAALLGAPIAGLVILGAIRAAILVTILGDA